MDEAAPPSEHEALAAELALNLLEGEDLARAQARRRDDPAFAREVAAWERRLCSLLDAVQPVEPPVGLWSSLRVQALGPAHRHADARADLGRLRRSLRVWRTLAVTASGLAVVLALALVWPRPPGRSAMILTARLVASPASPTVFVALYDPARRSIVLTPATLRAVAGRTPELWLIPPGAKPVALGLADFSGSVQLASQASLPSLQGGLLAVSLEPEGGSPSGQPTGPVIATGAFKRM